MVRALSAMLRDRQGRLGRAGHGRQLRDTLAIGRCLVLAGFSGCAIVPRSRMDECQKLTQALRAENARLKDRVFALQGQNRDYAERAVDDGRRLAIQDEAIERLEHSVQAYQDERTRLEAAYKQLVSNLGVAGHDPDGERTEASSRASARRRTRLSRPHARNSKQHDGHGWRGSTLIHAG